jgi:hypothetical protein
LFYYILLKKGEGFYSSPNHSRIVSGNYKALIAVVNEAAVVSNCNFSNAPFLESYKQ